MTSKRQKQSHNPILEPPYSRDFLVAKILSKLPIKPLLRFKSVSKSWYSCITCHHFCLLRNPTPNPASGLFLSIRDDDEESYQHRYISLNGNGFQPPFNLDFTTSPLKTEILHSCNGFLLCCSSISWDNDHTVLSQPNCKMYVYNPTTSSVTTLPDFPVETRLGATLVFDPYKSHHYKVVLVHANLSVGSTSTTVYGIQVYSSETRIWSSAGEKEFYSSNVNFGNGVYWNGSVHWMSREFSRRSNHGVAFRFNVDSLVLYRMRMPHVKREKNFWEKYYFGESCDHLHFVEQIVSRFNVYEMRRDYSEWFVRYRVDLTCFISYLDNIRIFSLVREESGENAKLVLRIPFTIVTFNLADGTSETLCALFEDSTYFSDDSLDGTYNYANERGLDYIQTICNVQ